MAVAKSRRRGASQPLPGSSSDVGAPWDPGWSVGLRIWVEREGRAVLGEGRADLLAGIDRTHSISAAARALGISYRHAWLMVQSVNEAAGEPLVESAVGGVRGGGARLTVRGRAVLDVFAQLIADVRQHAAGSLRRIVRTDDRSEIVVRLAAAISLQEAVGQILTEYALARPTTRVHTLFGASNELAEQVASGAPIDLLLSGDKSHLTSPGATAENSKRPALVRLATNGLTIVAPTASTIRLRTPRDLLRTEIRRIAVADPACPLGHCTAAYLKRLKLSDGVDAKSVRVDNSRAVLAAVRSGAAEVGIAFGSDAAQAADCRTLFAAAPREAVVEYYGAVVSADRAAAAARELLDFCTTEPAQRCLKRCGLGTS
jgi:molybdenum ABC transporter molybdate-binding protein